MVYRYNSGVVYSPIPAQNQWVNPVGNYTHETRYVPRHQIKTQQTFPSYGNQPSSPYAVGGCNSCGVGASPAPGPLVVSINRYGDVSQLPDLFCGGCCQRKRWYYPQPYNCGCGVR